MTRISVALGLCFLLALAPTSAQVANLPPALTPTIPTDIVASPEFEPLSTPPAARHVAIDEACAMRSLAHYVTSGTDGTLYGLIIPVYGMKEQSSAWEDVQYVVFTGVDDHSPYSAMTNTDRVKYAIRGGSGDIGILYGAPLRNVFVIGAFVSNHHVHVDERVSLLVVDGQGNVAAQGQPLTRLQSVPGQGPRFWGDIRIEQTTIAPQCIRDAPLFSEELETSGPLEMLAVTDDAVHYRSNGADAGPAFTGVTIKVRSHLAALKTLLDQPSSSPEQASAIAQQIIDELSLYGQFEGPTIPNTDNEIALLNAVRASAQQAQAYNAAYSVLREAAATLDQTTRLREAQRADRAFAQLEGFLNADDLQKAARDLEVLTQDRLSAQARARVAAQQRAQAQQHLIDQENAQRAATEAAAAQSRRETQLEAEAVHYSPQQRALILHKYDRMPDRIGTAATNGQTFITWTWGQRMYYFDDQGVIIKYVDL